MNIEIKKILNGTVLYGSLALTERQRILLLDYITNLQENYERIYNENCKLRKEHNITDISLLDENNRLKGSLNTAIEDIFTLLRVINSNVKELKCSDEELGIINKYSYNPKGVEKND